MGWLPQLVQLETGWDGFPSFKASSRYLLSPNSLGTSAQEELCLPLTLIVNPEEPVAARSPKEASTLFLQLLEARMS